jgi:uncharacterized membrane protein (TIGR02234 family)
MSVAMADPGPDRRGPRFIRIAQLLLLVAAGALYAASRLPWVVLRSFDTLGPPKTSTVAGASWSTGLVPLAMLLVAAALAALAVRGWPLRALALLIAMTSLAIGYLAVSLWVTPDAAVRAADIAHVPVLSLVGSDRHYVGAAITWLAAVGALAAAVLLVRSARADGDRTAKYAAPGTRRSIARDVDDAVSERRMWDALDEGRDPTDRQMPGCDTEGR